MKGHCTNCGRLCTICGEKADDFNLLSLPKNCRRLVTVALNRIGLNNDTDQSALVKGLMPYSDREVVIESALRKFLSMKNPPRNIAYIIAIVKGNSIRKKENLDALPPLAKGYENE